MTRALAPELKRNPAERSTTATLTSAASHLYAVIRDIRACFNRLKALADAMHRDLGITASMRAVMESLAEKQQPVPQIARTKGVSRQHIQASVDALLRKGLVELRENPAHKRSRLVTLTAQGQTAFAEIRRREVSVLAQLADGVAPATLNTTSELLRTLTQRLDEAQSRRTDDD
jgi:DNA-binding MarR family transcriptional regulator